MGGKKAPSPKSVKRFWELTLHKYLTNIYLCWEFALPTTTSLSFSGHFKRFQLNDILNKVTNFGNIFDKLSAPSEFFSFLRVCV